MMAEDLDFDAELAAAMLGAGGSAGAAGYYGAKVMSQPSSVPMLDVVDESPFIERAPLEIPDVEGGFGSPAQRRAASEASAGARGVRKAVNPRDLYVPEFAPGGQRQPLDLEGRSRFRDYMRTPGESNPNLGKLFDYVPEGTVGLLEEDARLARQIDQIEGAKSGNIFNTLERSRMDNQLSDLKNRRRSIAKVIEEIEHPGKYPFTAGYRARFSGLQKKPYWSPSVFDPEFKQAYEAMNMGGNLDVKHGGFGGFEDEYRKMASDEFGQKIEKGLDNARRYLDQSELARDLSKKKPVIPANIKKAASIMTMIPDPMDLTLLALAGPYEMMYGTEIGQEPGTGTFGIPLATTLQNASRILDKPLDSRHINVDTRIRLAEQDYPLASELHSSGVLSPQAFDIITRIRQARGGDTTVLPLLKPEPEAPEPGPAMGRPGRRF